MWTDPDPLGQGSLSAVLIWFVVLAPILVAEVFKSPMLDYRLVAFAAALPLVEVVIDGPLFLHTLLAPVASMTAVMLVFRGRRMKQRRWLGLPIGLFLHSILDGAWRSAALFWWPLLGFDFSELAAPETTRSLGLSLLLDAFGVVAAVWAWRRYELGDPANRRLMLSTGQLSRSVLSE